MTPEEQQQVNAMRAEYEQIIVNLSHQCSDKAALAETLAMRLKAAQEEIAKLTAPKKKKVVA